MPPFSSNGGGSFDTVDNANLNVHFSIPIVAKAGRGLPFDYILSFDSSVWSPYGANGSPVWTPYPGWGWGSMTDAPTGYVTYEIQQLTCVPAGHQVPYDIYSNWAYHDSSGTVHYFGITVSNAASRGCAGSFPQYWEVATTTDGSGYTMNADAGPSATTYTAAGGVIVAPLNAQTGNGTVTDPNGNQLTASYSGSTTTFTDTLGVTALTVSGAGTPASPMAYAYPNPFGGTSQVTVNYTAYTVGTNFDCSGVSEFKPVMS